MLRVRAAVLSSLALLSLGAVLRAESIGPPLEVVSGRSRKIAIEVERGSARIVAASIEDRPFVRVEPLAAPKAPAGDGFVQIEVVLRGAKEETFTRRVDFGPLCLEHPAWEEPHVSGDTILLHRDTFVLDLPAGAGFDRVELATYRMGEGESLSRTLLQSASLEALAPPAPEVTSGKVHWPEDYADPDVVTIYGNAGEAAQRTNIVIVPDGYTFADKSTLKAHADQMVAYFRSKTPYKEHDRFVNYILVYAYSTESGTDQCDCSIVTDTAMATSFPTGNPTCGHSDNRCLYYGSSCDPTANHLAEAESRAPGFDYGLGDRTIVMVNTTRYGGCGGTRAVYSAGNGSATEVAVHELGHSFAGLADEYTSVTGCGSGAGEVNTSTNAVNGAWPEWIADIGAPQQGAQYYTQCIYRPLPNCDMRALGVPFCPVCNQRFSLTFFGKPRVVGTAPVASVNPPLATAAYLGEPKSFSVGTRLATGPGVTNDLRWYVRGPGEPDFTQVQVGLFQRTHTFSVEGVHELRSIVTAATNFIKPSRTGANQDVVTWTVDVTLRPPTEVSPLGAAQPLEFVSATGFVWDAAAASGSTTFDLYRGDLTDLAGGGYGSCVATGIGASAYDDPAAPASGTGWFYLVAGRTSGGEGSLGSDSAGQPRLPAAPCP